MTAIEIDDRGSDVDHELPPPHLAEAPAPVVGDETYHERDDSTFDSADDDAWAALEAENRALREYLKRVLTMLETRADEGSANPRPEGDASSPVEPIHLRDLDRRLRRAEETIDDLLWLVRRLTPSSTLSVD